MKFEFILWPPLFHIYHPPQVCFPPQACLACCHATLPALPEQNRHAVAQKCAPSSTYCCAGMCVVAWSWGGIIITSRVNSHVCLQLHKFWLKLHKFWLKLQERATLHIQELSPPKTDSTQRHELIMTSHIVVQPFYCIQLQPTKPTHAAARGNESGYKVTILLPICYTGSQCDLQLYFKFSILYEYSTYFYSLIATYLKFPQINVTKSATNVSNVADSQHQLNLNQEQL